MLGSLIHHGGFSWTAIGKHPAALDYIHLASGSSLPEAVGDWMSKGYDQIARRASAAAEPHSFRFWLRGARKETLLFGLGRDSGDRIGRPFPFFIMGEGELKGWEQAWEDLPQRLDQVWRRMEAIAAGRYADLQALTEALAQLKGSVQAQSLPAAASQGDASIPPTYRNELQNTGRTLIDLGSSKDPAAALRQTLTAIKNCTRSAPPAVFIGGPLRRLYLAAVGGPLRIEDFVWLWST